MASNGDKFELGAPQRFVRPDPQTPPIPMSPREQVPAQAAPPAHSRHPIAAVLHDVFATPRSMLMTLAILAVFATYADLSPVFALILCLGLYYVAGRHVNGYRFVAGFAIGAMIALCLGNMLEKAIETV